MSEPESLVERLLERAAVARSEGTATALGDALHFEESAAALSTLRSRCETLERENAEERAMGNGWHKRWKAANAARDEAVRALQEIAFKRPPGPTRNRLMERIERVALDALNEIRATQPSGKEKG